MKTSTVSRLVYRRDLRTRRTGNYSQDMNLNEPMNHWGIQDEGVYRRAQARNDHSFTLYARAYRFCQAIKSYNALQQKSKVVDKMLCKERITVIVILTEAPVNNVSCKQKLVSSFISFELFAHSFTCDFHPSPILLRRAAPSFIQLFSIIKLPPQRRWRLKRVNIVAIHSELELSPN